ncbi:MAG: DUF6531 domain-containing protein [Opitutaceae bacterium]|jgi:RHS repeat-associated protein|nr:DUF6531 domain-containing protein [Opitutaceae bacterium]
MRFLKTITFAGIISFVFQSGLHAQWHTFDPYGPQPASVFPDELLEQPEETGSSENSEAGQTQVTAGAAAAPDYASGGYVTAADTPTTELISFAQGFGNAQNAEGQLTTDAARHAYMWVKNNIRFVPYPGSKRGAHMTWLERAGNDFDTCALLKALLTACGYQNVSYRFASVSISMIPSGGSDACAWLGVENQTLIVESLQRSMYYFESPYDVGSDGLSIRMPHVWVVLNVNGTQYVMDPSFKKQQFHSPVDPGIDEIEYSKSELQAEAGGNASTYAYLSGSSNMNAFNNKLTDYAVKLDDYLRKTEHGRGGAEAAGSMTIEPEFISALPQGLAQVFSINPGTTQEWAGMPAKCSVHMTILAEIDTNIGKKSDGTVSVYTSQLTGGKIIYTADSFRNTGASNLPYQVTQGRLIVEGITTNNGCETTIDPANWQNFLPDGEATISMKFQYPHVVVNNSPYEESARFKPVVRFKDAAYLISYGFGDTAGRLKWFLSRNETLTDDDVQYVIGMQHLVGAELFYEALGGVTNNNIKNQLHAAIVGAYSSPSIDIRCNLTTIYKRGQDSDMDLKKLSLITAYWISAMEHTCIEQSVQPKSAVSTVGLLMKTIQNNQGVYLAKNLAEFNNFKDQLTNYSSELKDALGGLLATYDRLVLPQDGAVSINDYSGYGFIMAKASPLMYGFMLSEGSGGGSGSSNNYSFQDMIALHNLRIDKDTLAPAAQSRSLVRDPVDASTGAFYKKTTDLVLGDGSAPMGLALARYYSSMRSKNDDAGLGRGWTHTYDIRLGFRHPTDMTVERASASEMAPIMVAARAIYDLFDYDGTARDWVLPAVAACWGARQLLDSRATVIMGDRTMEFVKRPDGSYVPPAGVDATLAPKGYYLELSFHKGLKIGFPAAGGRFSYISDSTLADGFKISANYNGDGCLASLTDAHDRTLEFFYSGSSLTHVKDSTGRYVYYDWSSESGRNVLSVTNPEGHASKMYFDENYRLLESVDEEGHAVVTNTYDSLGRVSTQCAFGDENRRWAIHTAEGLTRTTDPYGHTRWSLFDKRGRLWMEIDELGGVTTTKYDGADRLVSLISPEGRALTYTYDRRHRIINIKDPAGADIQRVFSSDDSSTHMLFDGEGNPATYEYNGYHQLISVTGPGGMVSAWPYYDTRGRVVRAYPASLEQNQYNHIFLVYTDVSGHGLKKMQTKYYNQSGFSTETIWFDARGDMVQTIDRNNRRTTYAYNNQRQLETISRWAGSHYAGVGTDPEPGDAPPTALTTRIYYNKAGDVIAITDPAGKTVSCTRDALGNVITVTDPMNIRVVENGYDYRGNLTVSYGPLGGEASWGYDAAGRVNEITDPLKRTSMITYDLDGLATSFTTPGGNSTAILHDNLGNPKTVEDPAGNAILYDYDMDSRQTGLMNRNENQYTVSYDLNGLAISSTTPLGHVSKIEYNTRGLVAKMTAPSGRVMENTVFDSEGRVLAQVVKSDAGAVEATREYAYMTGGQLISVAEITASGTMTATRAYDSFYRLTAYSDGCGGTLGYKYDKADNLIELTYPDGTVVAYEYDDCNRLIQVTDWANRVTRYDYDAAGRLVKTTRPNGTVRAHSYDLAGQLRFIAEHGPNDMLLWMRSCDYDQEGNMIQTQTWPVMANGGWQAPEDEASYDADNRLATWNSFAVAHDADGNMANGPLPDGTMGNYTYDMYDRLTSADGVASAYNPDGLRVSAGGASYVVDPTGLSKPLVRQQGGTATKYVWGLGLLYEETNNNIKTYHADHLGSTVALANASGTVTDRWEYSSYGTQTYRTGTSDTPFQFHGGLGCMTDANGLVYMRARFYNPRIMRFLNADPIGFSGGMNWYAFVGNNPMGFVDPEGLKIIVEGTASFIKETHDVLNEFRSVASPQEIRDLMNNLDASPHVFTIESIHFMKKEKGNIITIKRGFFEHLFNLKYKGSGATIQWDRTSMTGWDGNPRDIKIGLIHELGHAKTMANGIYMFLAKSGYLPGDYTPIVEIPALFYENIARAHYGYPLRYSYYTPRDIAHIESELSAGRQHPFEKKGKEQRQERSKGRK